MDIGGKTKHMQFKDHVAESGVLAKTGGDGRHDTAGNSFNKNISHLAMHIYSLLLTYSY